MIYALLRMAIVGFLLYAGIKLIGRLVQRLTGPVERGRPAGERARPQGPAARRPGFDFDHREVLDVPYRDAPDGEAEGRSGEEASPAGGEEGGPAGTERAAGGAPRAAGGAARGDGDAAG